MNNTNQTITAGALASQLAIITAWLLTLFGIVVPGEVFAALTVLYLAGVWWLTGVTPAMPDAEATAKFWRDLVKGWEPSTPLPAPPTVPYTATPEPPAGQAAAIDGQEATSEPQEAEPAPVDILTAKEQRAFLKAYGWRYKTEQERLESWALYQEAMDIGIDGICGPETTRTARWSLEHAHAKLGPALREHFYAREFLCKGPASDKGCKRLHVVPELLDSLELVRKEVGPITIISGYRCWPHNKRVGSKAPNHPTGMAADMAQRHSAAAYKRKGLRGIGVDRDSRKVRHADVHPNHSTDQVFYE